MLATSYDVVLTQETRVYNAVYDVAGMIHPALPTHDIITVPGNSPTVVPNRKSHVLTAHAP